VIFRLYQETALSSCLLACNTAEYQGSTLARRMRPCETVEHCHQATGSFGNTTIE
jgi:hypothetical protein